MKYYDSKWSTFVTPDGNITAAIAIFLKDKINVQQLFSPSYQPSLWSSLELESCLQLIETIVLLCYNFQQTFSLQDRQIP